MKYSIAAVSLVCFAAANGALAFAPLHESSCARTTNLFGNPLGGWTPAPAAAPADPVTPQQDNNPPSYSDWGMPAAASVAAPAPAPAWGMPAAAAPVVPEPVAAAPASFAAPVASGGDPIGTLDASQASIVQSIAAAIPDLEVKPDLSWSGEMVAGSPCTLDGRDAPGPANVAWLGSVSIPGKLSSLTIYNGPLTNVPHLLSRCYFDESTNQLQLALDFRPRAYGAYEMVDADGNYPGPEELGRKSFEYSGARADFFNKFATAELQATLSGLSKTLEGAAPTTIQPSELDLLTGSPLAITLTMPASDHNVQVVTEMRQVAADAWLEWVTDPSGTHDHRPGAPINTQYVYDSKFRQNTFLALKDYYAPIFGADATALAAAESGPLDEAYVGGGS